MIMDRRIPPIHTGAKILIICEGYEEYDYLTKLKGLGVWDDKFSIDIENAKSIDNIFAKYQYKYANNNYKLVVIFCDTEMYPCEKFVALRKLIDEMHGNKASNKILFFANPCTMQIILSHFAKVSLKTNSKSGNGVLISKYTGVCDYEATEKQRQQIFKKLNKINYQTMKNNLSGISENYTNVPSTNVSKLFDNLESYDKKWINSINKAIEE